MATMKLLLLLPLFTSARIHIDITAGTTSQDTQVEFSGYSKDIITDKDREIFKLRKRELNQAVYMLSGKRPDYQYLKGPTPLRWGDLYSGYGWHDVKRKIVPVYAKVLSINIDTVVVAKKHFNNSSPWSSSYGSSLSQQADMSVKNTWTSRSSSYSFDDWVSYSISLAHGNIGKSRSISYSNYFIQEQNKTSGIAIGSEISVSPQLEPGQSVDVVLTAKRGVVRFKVKYEASLSGDVACKYDKKFKGRHYWRYDVNSCLDAAGKPTKIYLTEIVEVGYFFDEKVIST